MGVDKKPLFLLILTLLWFFYFFNIITGKYFLWEDFIEQNYIYRLFSAIHLKKFYLPYWNPYIWGGLPFLGDVQSGIFYPLNLLLSFFVRDNSLSYWVVEMQALLHILFLGVFNFFIWNKVLKFGNFESLISSIVFMFSGRIIMEIIHLNTLHVVTYTPLVFGFYLKSLTNKNYKYAVLSGIVFGIAALGGYPQAQVWILSILFVTWLIWGFTQKNWLKPFYYLLLISFFGSTIPLISYLPALPAFFESHRAFYTREELLKLSFEPWRVITLLVPKFFGSIDGRNSSFYYAPTPSYFFWEMAAYASLFPILSLPYALMNKKRRFETILGISLIVLGVLLALGKYSPVYLLLFEILPPFRFMRSSPRFLLLYDLGMAIISAVSLEQLIRGKLVKPGFRIFVYYLLLGIAPLLWFLLYPIPEMFKSDTLREVLHFYFLMTLFLMLIYGVTKLKGELKAFFLSFLVFYDLYYFGAKFNEGSLNPREYYSLNPETQEIVSEMKNEFFRVNFRYQNYLIHPRNIGTIHHIFTIDGYNPLILARFNYLKESQDLTRDKFFTLYNVKYETVLEGNKASIKKRERYLPRAFLATRYVVITDTSEALKYIVGEKFNPYREIILEDYLPFEIEKIDTTIIEIPIKEYELNRVLLEFDSPFEGVLVLTENYFSRWKARVNNKEEKVFPVNIGLRGVFVKKGFNRVEFYYDSRDFVYGVLMCSFVIFVGLVSLIFKR